MTPVAGAAIEATRANVLPRYDPPPSWELGAPFWAAIERGELALPQCSICHRWQWYPDHGGTDCSGGEFRWTTVAPTGTVYSLTRVHRSFLPRGRDHAPYLVGLVDLDGLVGVDGVDGPRLVANLEDVSDMQIGARVQLQVQQLENRKHPVFALLPSVGGSA